jgi:peptidoglycan/LPS O-acetylase OafA/YrhL
MRSASSAPSTPLHLGASERAPAYRADIDGLRAIAVLLVLLFHFDLLLVGKAGFIGVDVFFVISGFLITSILKRQLDAGVFSLRSFYAARIRRLAPALFAVLALVMLAGGVILFQHDLLELARQVLFSQLYVVNIYYWRSINYFGLGTGDVFLLHMWSLAVEEQFYLLYPLAVLLLYRHQRARFWLWIAVGCLASFGLNLAFVTLKPEATFYLLPTRAWELLAGALVSFAVASWPRRRVVAEGAGGLGLALIAVAVVSYRTTVPFPGYFAFWPVAGACCLLWSGQDGATRAARALSAAPLTYVGRISYPLYLVHWPVNVFASLQLGERYDTRWRLAMFALSMLLSSVIYHLIEEPVRQRRVFAGRRSLLVGYGSALATTLAIVLVVDLTGGLPQRFPADVSRLAARVDDKSPPLAECEFTGKPLARAADFCAIGASGRPPHWLVYGDSHAWAAHAAFDKWLADKGEAGLYMYRHSCPPVVGVHLVGERQGCYEFNQAVAAFLAKSAEVTSVVLVSSWYEAPEGALTTAPDVRSSPAESLALFDLKFSETVSAYARLGKRVYVWAPVPGALRNVPLAMAKARLRGRDPVDVEVTRDQYEKSTAFFFAAVAKNRDHIAVLFSPADTLCGSGKCATTIDGMPAYFDTSHIARSSSDFWAAMMERAEQRANEHAK